MFSLPPLGHLLSACQAPLSKWEGGCSEGSGEFCFGACVRLLRYPCRPWLGVCVRRPLPHPVPSRAIQVYRGRSLASPSICGGLPSHSADALPQDTQAAGLCRFRPCAHKMPSHYRVPHTTSPPPVPQKSSKIFSAEAT